MDFSKIEIGEIQSGTWVHLEISGSPLFWDGKSVTTDETEFPCRVKMLSAQSNEVYRAFKAYTVSASAHQVRVGRAKEKEIDGIVAKHLERTEEMMDKVLVVAVQEFENIFFDGKIGEPTEENIRTMIDRKASAANRAIRAQLFDALSEQRENLADAA